jgi:hypothetical protein
LTTVRNIMLRNQAAVVARNWLDQHLGRAYHFISAARWRMETEEGCKVPKPPLVLALRDADRSRASERQHTVEA